MTKDEIFRILNDNPVFYLATCAGNKPRVRGMRLYRADERGIIFNTSTAKGLHKQLLANPSVELCFYDNLEQVQIRIRGEVELLDDEGLMEEIAGKMPSLKPMILGNSDNALAVYRLARGKVKVWKVDDDLAPRILSGSDMISIWMAFYNGD